jgi:hypothetical protein
VEALAQRLFLDGGLELPDEVRVAAHGQLGVGPGLERSPAPFLQPRDLGLRERLEREVGQWRAAPQPQRLAEQDRGLRGLPRVQRPAPVLGQMREALGVELVSADVQAVARRRRHQRVRVTERLAQPRDVDLDGLRSAGRSVLSPQRDRQPLGVHGLVRMQQQHGQDRARLDPTQCHRAGIAARLERPEDPVLHGRDATPREMA